MGVDPALGVSRDFPQIPGSDDGKGHTDQESGGTRELRFLVGKLAGAAFSLVMVVLSSFFLFRILGGNPLDAMTREVATDPHERELIRHQLGLDKPLSLQFVDYLLGVLHGDLGTSYQFDQPVTSLILERLPATLLLTGTAMAVSVSVGLWIGTRAGWRRGSTYDKVHVGVALTLWSAPTFWLGLIVIMVFGRIIPIFPVNSMISPRTPDDFFSQTGDTLYHLVLPVITMTAVVYAQYALVMRSSVLDEMGNDYLTTARAKGLRDDVVRRRHAVPNALLPTTTLIFMHLGGLVGGAILTETVFSWPGLGQLSFQALRIPDLPLLQGTFIVFSSAVIIANTVADILYRFLDPRVRSG